MVDSKIQGNKNILEKKKKVLITSALPYVNNVPHLGNIIGCVLSADVFARFARSYGCETLYICGTDEHGTTTEAKAIEEGLTPKEVCDKYFDIHKKIYEWFGCSFDSFGRTSSMINHNVSKDIFSKLEQNGFILEDDLEQMYDPKAKKYLADRFVEGTCPKCGFKDARGDQCDDCGNLLNPTDLINPKSKLTGTTPEVRVEKHLFIDLPKLSTELKAWIDKTAESANWSQNATTMTKGWLKTGLRPRCISRNLKWGVPIPYKGHEDKVFYSWFDAPIGYIGISKETRDDWKEWWHNPNNTDLYQFMGKDNIPFHTIMFPSFLIGSKDNYTLLRQISSTEYLNYEDGQFSKSRGTGVFGSDAMESGIPADVWRYYLLVNRPETSDTLFSWKDFQEKNNHELLANLGNFVNRTLTFIARNYEQTIPKPGKLGSLEKDFQKNVSESIDKTTKLLSQISLKDGLKEIMHISRLGNQYFQEKEPWVSFKDEKTKSDCDTTMYVCSNLVRKLAILVEPYLPSTSNKMFEMLNLDPQVWDKLDFKEDVSEHNIAIPEVLFTKYLDKDITVWKSKYAGKQQKEEEKKMDESAKQTTSAFSKLNLKVATIEEVDNHPDADKLFVIGLNDGEGKRQIVSGLVGYYTKEDLVGKNIILVSNLKPAKLRGKESNGMLLAAETEDDKVDVLMCPNSKPGDQVSIDGVTPYDGQIKYDDFAKTKMSVKGGQVYADEKPLKTDSEEIKSKLEDGAEIH